MSEEKSSPLKDKAPKISIISLAIVVAVGIRMFINAEPEQMVLQGSTMGTTWSVKVLGDSWDDGDRERIRGLVEKELDYVNTDMSNYHEGGQLDTLNKAAAGEQVPASEPLVDVLEAGRRISEKSGGAFDVTVGPLVRLWGFHDKQNRMEEPSAAELASAMARVGYGHISTDRKRGWASKAVDGLEVDLSAIAKGHGVDRVADTLERLGVENYMVEVGGEVRTRGVNAKGEPWRIGVELPSKDGQRKISTVVPLRNQALATSGDYRAYYEIGGKRFSHTIDPTTGRPVTHNLASVSIVTDKCMTADAAATAITVLGYEKGRALADSNGWAAYFILRKADGTFETHANEAFEELIK